MASWGVASARLHEDVAEADERRHEQVGLPRSERAAQRDGNGHGGVVVRSRDGYADVHNESNGETTESAQQRCRLFLQA